MHNIGRTVQEAHEFEHEFENEFENEFEQEFEFENEFENEAHEHEFEHEFEHEAHEHELGSILGSLFGEQEFEQEAHEQEFEHEFEHESPFNEAAEMELASELLSIRNEQEMEQFLGKLIRGATRAVSNFARSNAGRALGGVLKRVAKVALPIAGKVAGGFIGGPAGAMLGSKLGSMAGKAFGLELEGLSAEDREFEVARAYVRFAGSAARRAARNRNFSSQPRKIVRRSVVGAARRWAPGLLTPIGAASNAYGYDNINNMDDDGSGNITGRTSGRWVRRGSTIILYGA